VIFTIDGINPEPWTAPEVSIGRKGGKTFPMVYKTETLRAYQEAVKDALSDVEPQPLMDAGSPIRLDFYFWRQLAGYEIGDGKKSRRHLADATNLQKSLEDALQGILFKNDRDVWFVTSTIVEQDPDTDPGIVIRMSGLFGHPIPPDDIATEREKMLNRYAQEPRQVDRRADIDIEDVF